MSIKFFHAAGRGRAIPKVMSNACSAGIGNDGGAELMDAIGGGLHHGSKQVAFSPSFVIMLVILPVLDGGDGADGPGLRFPDFSRRSAGTAKPFPWTDADRVHRLITEEIPTKVAADTAYQNAKKHSDKQNARIEHDKALARVMTALLKDDTELFKQFSDNPSFKKWLADTVFSVTYPADAA